MRVATKSRSKLVLAGIGLTAGLLAGMFGVGGGIVLVPLLLVAGVDQHRAHATSMLAILVIASAGVIRFATAGEVDWAVGLLIALGAVVGSTIGSRAMSRMSPEFLRGFFIVLLIVAGVRMATGGDMAAGDSIAGWLGILIALAIGLGSGFAAGVAGVGGGIIMVPAMVFFLGMAQHAAEGTSLMVIIFTAVAATRVNLAERRVELSEGLVIGAAGVISALVGATFALQLDGPVLSQIFGLFALAVAVRMAWSIRPVRLRNG